MVVAAVKLAQQDRNETVQPWLGARNSGGTVAAAHKNQSLRNFPLLHGMLHAGGETIEGPRPCDSFDVFADEAGNLVVLLMDVHASVERSGAFAASLMHETRDALYEHQPLHAVVNALQMQLAARPDVEVGLAILRLSQREAKVELLNAGMPAFANAGPGEHVVLHAALSGPVGRRVGEVHPYELVPLTWGSTWLAVSDGMVNGSLDPKNVSALCESLELGQRGLSLTMASTQQQYDAFQGLLVAARFLRDDATFVLVSADAGTRFQSAIVPGDGEGRRKDEGTLG